MTAVTRSMGPSVRRPAWSVGFQLAGVTALYVAAALLGLQYAGPDGVSALWPSAGLAVAAVLLGGPVILVAVAAGSIIVNIIDGTSPPLTAWIAAVSTFEAFAAAWLMTRWSTAGAFHTLRDVPGFFAAAGVSTAASAAMAAVGLQLYGANTEGVAFGTLFNTWWSGGLVGILVVTPLLLEWSRPRTWTTSGARWVEMIALAATVLAIASAALLTSGRPSLSYMVFAPLAWAAWRFGARGATMLSVFFAGVIVEATAVGLGPFAGRDTLHVQVFLLFVTVTAVFLGLGSQATQNALDAARASELQSQEQLTQVEEIFEHSPNGLAFLDRSLSYRQVNQRFAAVVGLKVGDFLGRSIDEVDALTDGPRLGQLLTIYLRQVLDGGPPVSDLVYTWPAEAPRGPARVWKVGVSPHESPDGSVSGLYIETVDITDLRRAEDQRWALERKLAAARDQESRALRQSDAMKSALLSSVSHELRTPLTSMRTALSGLAEESLHPETRRELVASAMDDAEYLSRLVNNLLDMSRLEGGLLLPDRQWHTADELIETAVRRVGEALAGRALHVSTEDAIPPLHVDGVQVQLALVNLLDNAAKYSPPGTPLHVVVSVDPAMGVLMRVRNQGHALTPDEETHVFDRFFRVARSGPPRVRGLGLGLSIAKGAVDAHGGHIWTRRDGEWTEFGFRLPLDTDGGALALGPPSAHGH